MKTRIRQWITCCAFWCLIVLPGFLFAQTYDEVRLVNGNLVHGTIIEENNRDVTIEVTEIMILSDADTYQRFSRNGLPVTISKSDITGIQRDIISQDSSDTADEVTKSILLTVDTAIEIAMDKSYRIRLLELGIERTRLRLRSSMAGLKSRVSMELQAPEISAVSEEKWNSSLKKSEIVHENTRRWQMDLSIRQPVMVFGNPTNGYLSLNNKVYKYLQTDGQTDVDYYNRFFAKFEQPIFLPNRLKNDIERSKLELEQSEIDYIEDRVHLIDRMFDDYYELFELTFKGNVYHRRVETLEIIEQMTRTLVKQDPSRAIELTQVQVELTNTKERVLQNSSMIRHATTEIKESLHMTSQDSIYIDPAVTITPVEVDVNQAIQYGYTLHPSLKTREAFMKRSEISLSNSKGHDGFHMNLEMTYGLENNEDQFDEIWDKYDKSHSVSLSAHVPVLDWGRRKNRIGAAEIMVELNNVWTEEVRDNLTSNIISAVDRLRENQQRILNMQNSVGMASDITDVGLQQFQAGAINAQGLMMMLSTQLETELNFLAAYLSYRRSLHSLMLRTYYDYENDMSLFEKFGVDSYYTNDSEKKAEGGNMNVPF